MLLTSRRRHVESGGRLLIQCVTLRLPWQGRACQVFAAPRLSTVRTTLLAVWQVLDCRSKAYSSRPRERPPVRSHGGTQLSAWLPSHANLNRRGADRGAA